MNAATDAFGELHLWTEAQFLTCWFDVAPPVALSHDVVFVVVECRDLSCAACDAFADEGDDAQEPEWRGDANPPGVAEFLADEVAEGGRLIDLAVGEEVTATCDAFLQCEEYGLYDVGDIDEGDVLLFEAYGEIGVGLDALRHHEVVAFARTVNPRGTEDDVGQRLLAVGNEVIVVVFQPSLGVELALAVSGIGLWRVALADLSVGLLLANGAHDAETADIDETLDAHLEGHQDVNEVLGALGIYAVEVGFVETFGDACGMHDIVELQPSELFGELRLGREIEFDEIYTLVGKELA